MRKTPFDWQNKDARHVVARRSALVGHEPRVGKSAVGIKAADNVRAKLVVIVCPANVRPNWEAAIDDFRTGSWVAIIVSWAKATEFNMKMRRWGRRIDVLILDESHYGKERSAARTKAVYGPKCDGEMGLAGMADRVYGLTGTPLPNNPTELWPILRAVAPELILNDKGRPMSFSAFRDRYCAVVNNGFGGIKIRGARRYGELKSKLFDSGFMIRRTRQEVFGRDILPPTDVYIDPPRGGLGEIRAVENSPEGIAFREALERGGLAAVAKLRGTAGATLRRLYGLAKVPGIASLVADELDEEPGAKLVIGAWHLDVINALAAALRKYGAVTFTGSLTPDRKKRINDKFQFDPTCRVVVGQIVAMGVGLDFSKADNCLFAEQSWVGTDNEQFRSRIFNVASTNPKFTRFAKLRGTMDILISTEAERKLRDAKKIHG